jgi:hypothetical protein
MVRSFNRWLIFAIILIVAGGLALTMWSVQREDSLLRTDLLIQAHLLQRGIDPEYVKGLSGSESDLGTSDYRTLKDQMIQIRNYEPEIRFVHLIGQRPDGTLFFYMNSVPP